MSVLSKLPRPVIVGTVAFLSWAAWYDHHRRSKPDYLDNLVEKRKNELLENRRKNDPLYLVKSLSLCSKPDDPMAVQEYAMNLMTEGEMELEADKNRGASKIALGLAYFPMQQLQMIFMQLSQSMPQDILLLIRERLNVAKARVQSQRIESMMAAQSKKKESEAADKPKSAIEHLSSQAAGPIREITQSVDEEPKDVDSIDGDSEERIVDLGEVEDKEEPKIEELEEDEIDGTETEQKIAEAIQDEEEQNTLPHSQENTVNEDDTKETIDLVENEQKIEIEEDSVEPVEQVEQPEQDQTDLKEEEEEKLSEQEITSEHEVLAVEQNDENSEEASQPNEMIQEMNNLISSESKAMGEAPTIQKTNNVVGNSTEELEEDEEMD